MSTRSKAVAEIHALLGPGQPRPNTIIIHPPTWPIEAAFAVVRFHRYLRCEFQAEAVAAMLALA